MQWFSCHSCLLAKLSAMFTLVLQLTTGQLQLPQFTSVPSNVTAYEMTTLLCSVSGSPTPDITWLKDGVPLDTSDPRFTPSPQGLGIRGLQGSGGASLEGVYHCIASNLAGSVRSTSAVLTRTVWVPGFSPQEQEVRRVPRNDPLQLPCRLPQQSTPPATVMWDPDPASVDGEVGVALDGRLIFSSFLAAASQVYTCTITNPVSLQSLQSSDIFVNDDLNGGALLHTTEFVVEPVTQQTRLAGETLTLECFTTGNPPAMITWSKNSSPLGSGGRVSTHQGGRQLVITSLESQDAGTYMCTAGTTNSPTLALSASATVQIIEPPQIVTQFPEMQVNASQSLSISCSAVGTTPLMWVWLHNGQEIAPSESDGVSYEEVGPTSTLTISSLTEEDRGVYQCLLTQQSTGREAEHNQYIDVVVVPPMFLPSASPSADVLVLHQSTVTIPCIAKGFPPPTFSWVRLLGGNDRRPITLDDRHSIPPAGTGNGSLTISPVMIGDSSTLKCLASNSANSPPAEDVALQLKVIAEPGIQTRPPAMEVAQPGAMVTLPCAAEGVIGGTIQYRWTRDGDLVGVGDRSEGALTIGPIRADESDNGLYECSLVVRMNGVGASLIIPVQPPTTLTVGEPAMAPSSPMLLLPPSLGANFFIAGWSASLNNGGLQIQNYTIEVMNLGSSFCPAAVESEWEAIRTGIRPGQSSYMVNVSEGVNPAMGYLFRVVVFNSVYRSYSSASEPFTTSSVAPRDVPTGLRVLSTTNTEITISWATPTSCLGYGGPLEAYIVEYRVQGDAQFLAEMSQSSNARQHTISGLQPGTLHQVRVAASNAVGGGPFTTVVMATTLQTPGTPRPLTPPGVMGTVINSTTVMLSWSAPPTSSLGEVLNYTLCYIRRDGTVVKTTFPAGQLSVTVTGLRPGVYNFNVTALYLEGRAQGSVSLILPSDGERGGILEQVWFYASVAGAGTVLVVILTVLICCICCLLCCKKNHYKVGGKRSEDDVDIPSNHFTEYRRKGKNNSTALPHVVVHSSPTPSRRSTDYAVPSTLHTTHPTHPVPPSTGPPSTGPPSTTNITSSTTPSPQFSTRNAHYGHMNGNAPNFQINFQNGNLLRDRNQFHPYRDMTPSIQDLSFEDNSSGPDNHMSHADHIRQVSASTSHKFVDTLSRVHTPPPLGPPPLSSLPPAPPIQLPPPPPHPQLQRNFGSSYLARDLSQDVDEPLWNPGELLNERGHMTNNPVGRADSFRSTESSNSMEFHGPSQLTGDPWRQGAIQQLAPLHEGHFVDDVAGDSMAHGNGRSGDVNYLTRVDEIRMKINSTSQSAGRWNKKSKGRREKEGISPTKGSPLVAMEMKGSPLVMGRQEREEVDTHLGLGYGEGERGYHQGGGGEGTGFVASYEPEVHMSHSRSIYQPTSHTPSDSGYAVPPSRTLQRPGEDQLDTVYHYPPPAYAAPPPPGSRSPSPPHTSLRPTSERGIQLPTTAFRDSLPPTTLSWDNLPPTTSSWDNPPQHCSIPTGYGMGHHSVSAGSGIEMHRTNSATAGTGIRQHPSATAGIGIGPGIGIGQHHSTTGGIGMGKHHSATDSIGIGQHHSASTVIGIRQHHSATPGLGMGIKSSHISEVNHGHSNSMASNTSHSSSEVRRLQVTPLDGQGPLATSPQGSISHTLSSPHNSSSSLNSSIGSGWSLDKIQRRMEQQANSFENMLTPLQETLEDGTVQSHMMNGHLSPPQTLPTRAPKPRPPTLPKPPPAPKPVHTVPPKLPEVVPQPDRRRPLPQTVSPPPDVVQSSGNHGYSSDEEDPTSIAINKKRPKVPDLTSIPRKPRVKVKKVPRSVWQPRAMTRAIQSSSSESDSEGSEVSVETVIAPGDSSTLRSAHV